ncbi:hypothetical protein KSS87_004747, partial [Heliosperma pusillum]
MSSSNINYGNVARIMNEKQSYFLKMNLSSQIVVLLLKFPLFIFCFS